MTQDSPFFSVVVPAYNRADLLREALESVFQQEERDFEVIVVDDGSPADLSRVVRDYEGRVTFLRQENGGPGVARNRGGVAAKGQYLAFLDSDDVWFPWTLSVYRDVIETTGAEIVGGRLAGFAERDELAGIRRAATEWRVYADFLASSPDGVFVGAGMVAIRRRAFERAGGFCSLRINCEDHDLMLRLGEVRPFASITAPATLGYRRHDGSATCSLAGSIAGVRYLFEQEADGAYPGGAARRRERRRIITSHARPVSIEAMRRRQWGVAWELYGRTVGWHVGLGRVRYLLAFPALAAVNGIGALIR